jgi:hypothetical protein
VHIHSSAGCDADQWNSLRQNVICVY